MSKRRTSLALGLDGSMPGQREVTMIDWIPPCAAGWVDMTLFTLRPRAQITTASLVGAVTVDECVSTLVISRLKYQSNNIGPGKGI